MYSAKTRQTGPSTRPYTSPDRSLDASPDTGPHASQARTAGGFAFRPPRAEDGPAVSGLIQACPPLDTNSAYCNLLQCTHFADTCVLAERDGRLLGWVSAYRPPAAPEQLFVWQVAVHADARGSGLGGRLLDRLLARPAVAGATTLATTITESNAASWALFASLARRLGARLDRRPIFDRHTHFAGAHDTEHLVSIGPLQAGSTPSEREDA